MGQVALAAALLLVGWLLVSHQVGTVSAEETGGTLHLPLVQAGRQVLAATATATPTATASPIPTATVTATPSPTASPTQDPNVPVITNGDFELGPGTGWVEQSPLGAVIVQQGPNRARTPTAGGWFAWLGGAHNLGETVNYQSRLSQDAYMVLPAGQSVFLHLQYQILSVEQPNGNGICDRDVLNLWVNTPNNSTLWYQAQVCQQFNTNGWTPAVIDLSFFAGQPIALEFQMRTDFANLSHVLLDDLQLRSTAR